MTDLLPYPTFRLRFLPAIGVGIGVTDGDKGEIVVSGAGTVWTLDQRLSNHYLSLLAGTVSEAPLIFSGGLNLTNPTAGAQEYDGKAFYTTPQTGNRALNVAEHTLAINANLTGVDSASAQSWFTGGATGITLPAATSYFFDGLLVWKKTAGTVSHVIQLLFGGTATLTSIMYEAIAVAQDAAAFSAVAPAFTLIQVATGVTVWPTASTSANQVFACRVKGIVRINAGGTFLPQFLFSAAPGGAPTIQANSYFRMRPFGTNTAQVIGNWA